jgi:hypothetical protein
MKDVTQQLKSGMPVAIDGNLSLRVMAEKDITSAYVAWLNDDEVVQYTEQRFFHTTAGDVRSFIDKMAEDPTELMYGIFLMINISGISSWATSIVSIKPPIYLI